VPVITARLLHTRARRAALAVLTALAAIACASAPAPAGADAPSGGPADSPFGAHSMAYLDTPLADKERLFSQAAAMGASTIRLDMALSAVFPSPTSADWSQVDETAALARKHGLRILADVLAPPWWLPCLPDQISSTYTCGVDPSAFGHLVARLAARTAGTVQAFEIVNEPDGAWAFSGTPEQYARMLAASYDAVKAVDPSVQVVMGGLMRRPDDQSWLERAFAAVPGLAARTDAVNVHLRGPIGDVRWQLAAWRAIFGVRAPGLPLWVTEAGYPADPAYQADPGYQDGEPAQARYVSDLLTVLLGGGAAKVFVTERDNLGGGFGSEGLVADDGGLMAARPRQAFEAFRAAAARWPALAPLSPEGAAAAAAPAAAPAEAPAGVTGTPAAAPKAAAPARKTARTTPKRKPATCAATARRTHPRRRGRAVARSALVCRRAPAKRTARAKRATTRAPARR
jgi:hypothetical protein